MKRVKEATKEGKVNINVATVEELALEVVARGRRRRHRIHTQEERFISNKGRLDEKVRGICTAPLRNLSGKRS